MNYKKIVSIAVISAVSFFSSINKESKILNKPKVTFEKASLTSQTEVLNNLEEKVESETSNIFLNTENYASFIKKTVNDNFFSEVMDIYNFYNIKLELPKYGFKIRDEIYSFFDLEGAVYKYDSDSIYFFCGGPEDLLIKYAKYYSRTLNSPEKELTKRLKYYIKHEASHVYFYELAKKINPEHYSTNKDDGTIIYDVTHSLIEEGIAEYISYKGEMTPVASLLVNSPLKNMPIEDIHSNIYGLGFLIVKPVLDTNFEKGLLFFIKNPLHKKDLNNLEEYTNKILREVNNN